MLLQVFYSIRSERQLCERLQYDLLFKWFVGLNILDPVFDHSTFSKNRERLLEHDVTSRFFEAVRSEARLASVVPAFPEKTNSEFCRSCQSASEVVTPGRRCVFTPASYPVVRTSGLTRSASAFSVTQDAIL